MIRLRRPSAAVAAACAVLAAYWLMATSVSPRLGLTYDEPGHIASGYAAWRLGDFRVNAESGPLGNRLTGLPLAVLDVQPPPREVAAAKVPNARALGEQLLFAVGNNFETITQRSRAVIAGCGVLLLWLIWRWARGLFGARAGWIALGLAAFSPTLLAHGGLATTDMVVTVGLFAALSATWRLWHRITPGRVVVAGAACAAALLAKMSGALLLPMLALLLVARIGRRAPLWVEVGSYRRLVRGAGRRGASLLGVTALIAAMSGLAVWAAYDFRYQAAPPGSPADFTLVPSWETLLTARPAEGAASAATASPYRGTIAQAAPTPVARTVRWLREHRVLPEAYLWGLTFTLQAARERPSYFFGDVARRGSPWFFPAAFLLKTTLAELALLAAGLVGIGLAVRRTLAGRRRWRLGYRLLPLLVLVGIYGGVALSSALNIGHRHLLPIYPAIFVVAGGAVLGGNGGWRRIGAAGVAVLLAVQVVESWAARPFYLSYFTPFVGGARQGWRYLVDSSLDWGQGLPDLQRWIEERRRQGDATPVFLTYFGSDSPRARGLPVVRVADWHDDSGARNYPAPLKGGWYAISATHYHRVYLGVSGPWSEYYEQRRLETWQAMPRDAAGAAALTPEGRERWLQNAKIFEVLQFGRLCHLLRDREPALILGASILVFRLTDEEVRLATTAPWPELEEYRRKRRAVRSE